jgi:hypothetical protein
VIASAWWYGFIPLIVVLAFFVGVIRARRNGKL